MTGLYVHIPFCASRCIYCSFYSITSRQPANQYIDALIGEMQLRPCADLIPTIYIGGGTPSLLSAEQLKKLFDNIYACYAVAPEAEVTIECNPDDVTDHFAHTLEQLPINRVSMGVQTFSDDRLRFLHRRHTARQIPTAVKALRNHGIDNISLDLIFGFPDETIAEWEQDIDATIALGVEHISAYSLMYEEGTALYRMLQSGKIKEIDEETSLAMYNLLTDRLADAGYHRYEISNFARNNRHSRHNSSYWQNSPYIGLGAAAHSYDGRYRQWNADNIKQYMEGVRSGKLAFGQEYIDSATAYNDLITTALRTATGIDLDGMKQKYGATFYRYLIENATPHLENSLLTIEGQHLRLTRKGIFVSDDVMSDLIYIR